MALDLTKGACKFVIKFFFSQNKKKGANLIAVVVHKGEELEGENIGPVRVPIGLPRS